MQHSGVVTAAVFVCGFGLVVFTSVSAPWATPAVWILIAALTLWKAPALIAVVVVGYACRNGELAIFASPVLVMLASLQLARCRGHRINGVEWIRVAGIASLAFLLSFLVNDMVSSSEPQPGFVSRGDSTSVAEPTRTPEGGNPAEEQQGGSSQPQQPPLAPSVDSAEPPEPNDVNKSKAIAPAMILFAGLIAVIVWRAHLGSRHNQPSDAFVRVAESVARLQSIGTSLGRPREPHEGLLDYADALASQFGDHRYARLGAHVSAAIYDPGATDLEQLDSYFAIIEADLAVGSDQV